MNNDAANLDDTVIAFELTHKNARNEIVDDLLDRGKLYKRNKFFRKMPKMTDNTGFYEYFNKELYLEECLNDDVQEFGKMLIEDSQSFT